jgi:TolA-binding protein
MQLIVGDIMLRQQRFDAAIAAYKQYQTNYPKGAYFEQATYRSALALLFGGKAEQADDAIRTYIRKYPEGIYVPDAEYRLDVIKFAAKEYNEVITDCVAWQQKYGDAGPLAEVLCLQGDCYASLDMPDDAVKAYTRSYKAAKTDEVLNYSLFAAAKILQQQRKWADISKMFYEFIKDNPDSPFVAGSVVWIGRADIKLGKVDEAKQFMAATAKQYLNDPTREAVDEILTQLAQLFAKKHLPLPAAPVPPASSAPPNVASSPTPGSASITNAAPVVISAPATNAVPVASSEPVAVPDDPAKDLENILMIPDLGKEETASARILYVKSELARFQRKPQIEQEILLEIADKFKPEVLSPALLAQVGDCLFQTGKPDQAEIFYHYLLDTYDQSPLVDYAYNGLGLIAYDQKDYKKALSFYSKALDKGVAATKLKEITLGAAQTFLALDRLDEAKSLFEQVASNRAWRGEATALSVFSLGEIQMRKQKYAEANAFYQHVFVAYQKYPAIQAKAYLKSGEAFENLGKIPEAVNTYNEMLRNPNLASFPEAQEVKQRLQNLVQK